MRIRFAFMKRKKKEPLFPVEVCKFYRLNGECTELVDRLCVFKRINYNGFLNNDNRCAICMKYKQEE